MSPWESGVTFFTIGRSPMDAVTSIQRNILWFNAKSSPWNGTPEDRVYKVTIEEVKDETQSSPPDDRP